MVVVLKLSSHNYYDLQNLQNIIQTAVIDDRNIGNLKTESTGFSFIELGGKHINYYKSTLTSLNSMRYNTTC